jgi:DNA polymerase (family 10)
VLKLYSELGIASLEGLEQAARQDRLKNVKGLGAALQSKILQGIDIKRRGEGQRHLHRATALLEAAEANLRRSYPGLIRITPAGDFPRGCELVSDLSLVAEVPKLDGARRNPIGAEAQAAEAGDKDICGILHAHTDLSDGVDTLGAMAEATRTRGYAYFGIADHSKSAHYAGGLSVEEIADH